MRIICRRLIILPQLFAKGERTGMWWLNFGRTCGSAFTRDGMIGVDGGRWFWANIAALNH